MISTFTFFTLFASLIFLQSCHGLLNNIRSSTEKEFSSKLFGKLSSHNIGRRAFTLSFMSLAISPITISSKSHAYTVSGITDKGLADLRKQEEGTRAFLTKFGLGDDLQVIPIEPGTPSYDNGLKIMKRFNQSMEEYERGSWEILRLDVGYDIKSLLKEAREVKIDSNKDKGIINYIQQRIPENYRRKIAVELPNIIRLPT